MQVKTLMQELLYAEAPTPNHQQVLAWLQTDWQPLQGQKYRTPEGLRLRFPACEGELSVFIWSLQRTTYLKAFRWGDRPLPQEASLIAGLKQQLATAFPNRYPAPPQPDPAQASIFDLLEADYPLTVKYFRQIPNGEYDLNRVYWWEQRWREGVRNPQQPRQVVFSGSEAQAGSAEGPLFDLIYLGGALGVIHAAVMAQRGFKALLIERLPFGRMNREWNISRVEFQSLIDLGLFTPAEFERVIAREYVDGFHKFFDANNPPQARSAVLHTPTVLNIAIDSEELLKICGDKLRAAGGLIWDETEFERADILADRALVTVKDLRQGSPRQAQGRLIVDAMGTASPIAFQLNGGRPFDSVCPTVGGIFSGLDPAVWDSSYGDVLFSHGDLSRGRQLIWELFPARGDDFTVYLFHYHQIHPNNPGSLLEMYEDFFTILPEYRRCDLDQLTWKKATFGYIPGYFSTSAGDRRVGFDRVLAIGDAASLQSPLIFTGFGSLVRNLPRLSDLLTLALEQDCLSAADLNLMRPYQRNVSVTWLFSKGMMVPTGRQLGPERINAMLNTFFDVLASEPTEVAEAFMKDRARWMDFNRMAIKAASKNPAMLAWIWDLAGPKDMLRWLLNYVSFGLWALISLLFRSWFPALVERNRSWLAPRFPELYLRLLAFSYAITDGMGLPQWDSPGRRLQASAYT
jgi:lycopene cyclase CruA